MKEASGKKDELKPEPDAERQAAPPTPPKPRESGSEPSSKPKADHGPASKPKRSLYVGLFKVR